MRHSVQKNNSIEKALQIILTFIPGNQEMGTVEISQKLGFHKATVSRILSNLVKFDFIQQNGYTKKFRLGQSALDLGRAVTQSVSNNHITHLAKPLIDKLRDSIRETAVLEVLLGESVIMGYIAEGLGPIRIKGILGETRPAHCSAGAKAILAFSSAELKKHLLNGGMKPFTPNTITDIKTLERQLKEIRKQGFAFDNEEVNVGINAVAAPVFDHEEKTVAAVAVAGLSQGITWETGSPIVGLVKETASEISKHLYSRAAFRGSNESDQAAVGGK